MGTFSASVSDFIAESLDRMNAVTKQSAQEVFSIAQTPQRAGGRMPVDTGFLRNTGSIAINAMPRGPSKSGDFVSTYQEDELVLTLAQVLPGDEIRFGWSAIYAWKMEELYGFAQAAAMQWESIVTRNARALETRLTR